MNNTLDPEIIQQALILWNYHNFPNDPCKSDFILVLGSEDHRVADEAALLLHQDLAPFAVVSGGFGKVTANINIETEAHIFSEILRHAGIAENRIIQENAATNTGDNFLNTRALLQSLNRQVKSGLFVTKPYMKRRVLATAQAQWPEIEWTAHAPALSFFDYPNKFIHYDLMINLMVGDTQRIAIYPERGFQVAQEIPDNVWSAYEILVAHGYTDFVI
jgi:uncharacterized SAM-binding protein YcdF (DUF218 family)